MSPTWPSTIAAITGPTPCSSTSAVPVAATCSAIRCFVAAVSMSMRSMSARCSRAEPETLTADRVGRFDGVEQRPGLSCADPQPGTASEEFAEHHVQSARGLRAQTGQVVMTVREQLQHSSATVLRETRFCAGRLATLAVRMHGYRVTVGHAAMKDVEASRYVVADDGALTLYGADEPVARWGAR
jgi:hypothetical protein